MAITLDKQAVANSTALTVVASPAATATGALLVAAISFATASSQTITGVTDSAGNTWTSAPARFQSGTNSYFQYWYATNAASVTSVTATGSSTSAKGINVTSWTSNQGTLTFETENGTGAAASTTATASTLTTVAAGTLVLKGINHNGSAAAGTLSWTGGTALTKPTSTSTGQSQDVAYKRYSSAGQSEATSWTIVSGAYGTSTIVFAEPAASGTTYTKTGGISSALATSAGDAATHAETAEVISPLSVSAADVHEAVETGGATSSLAVSGVAVKVSATPTPGESGTGGGGMLHLPGDFVLTSKRARRLIAEQERKRKRLEELARQQAEQQALAEQDRRHGERRRVREIAQLEVRVAAIGEQLVRLHRERQANDAAVQVKRYRDDVARQQAAVKRRAELKQAIAQPTPPSPPLEPRVLPRVTTTPPLYVPLEWQEEEELMALLGHR